MHLKIIQQSYICYATQRFNTHSTHQLSMEILTEITEVTSPKTFHTMLDLTSTDMIDKTSSKASDVTSYQTLEETSSEVKPILLQKLTTFRNTIHSPSANSETVLAEYDKLASVYDEVSFSTFSWANVRELQQALCVPEFKVQSTVTGLIKCSQTNISGTVNTCQNGDPHIQQ